MNFDDSEVTRELIRGMEHTGYFSFVLSTSDANKAYHLLRTGKALLILTIPAGFTQALYRHEDPQLLLEDGSIDSLSTGRAIIALTGLKQRLVTQLFPIALPTPKLFPSFQIVTHRIYDAHWRTQVYVVPGMIGLVLMLTMLLITVIIAFRDIQGGTIEYLLVSPTHPAEVLLGEIISYIIIGYLQLTFGLLLACYLFNVPFIGHPGLLYLCALPYIVAELALGLTIATFCKSQFEAAQIVNIFIAFSIILTGFVFPVFSMPEWAQTIGLFLPLTHFFNILFGVMLRGNDLSEIWMNLWPLLIYCIVMIAIAAMRFKRQFK